MSTQQYSAWMELCELILKSDIRINCVAIINKMGNVIHSKECNSVIYNMPKTKQDMFFIEYSLRQHMRKEFDDEFGVVRYTYVKREKEGVFTFPIGDLLMIIGCRNEVTASSFSKKIISIVNKQTSRHTKSD